MKRTDRAKKFSLFKSYGFWILLISLIPLVPLFITSDLLHTHDGLVHLPRLAAFFKALQDGQFPVRWAGELNYTYGMPLFNFIYHLPYYVGSVFLLMGFGLVTSFKFSLALSFILSGIFMYLFAQYFFEDRRKGFLVAVLYQFAPFRFVELLVRGSYGEVYTYTFLPLVLFGLMVYFRTRNVFSLVLTSIATALLVLSHNSVSLLFFGVAVIFVLFFARSIAKMIAAFLALGVGLGISAYYWIPAILEHKYTNGNIYMRELYSDHFVPFYKFFIPDFSNFNVFQFHGITVFVGVFQLIAMILAFGFLLRYKFRNSTDKRVYFFSFALFAASILFMLELSRPLWSAEFATFLRQFQFPWRFLSVGVFVISLLGVAYFQIPQFHRKYTYIGLIFFIVLSSLLYLKPVEGYDKIDEKYYWDFPLNTTYYGETDVIWSGGQATSYPAQPVEIISGDGQIENVEKKSHIHLYSVVSSEDSRVVDHTQYFPGWRVYVNGQKTDIQFQDPNHRGEITFFIPPGTNDVQVVFEESKVRFVANVLSVLSLFIVLGFVLLSRFKKAI